MKRLIRFAILLFFGSFWNSALQAETSGAHIAWDQSTLTLIQSNGYYGRIIRLNDGRLACGFDEDRKIWIRHSTDDGKTWPTRKKVAEWPLGRLTNTELLQLKNGSLLCFYNERPRNWSSKDSTQKADEVPYSICIVRSDDHGETWTQPERLYSAGVEFTNGCWEPAAMQLPSGEIQLFFSNEGPYRTTDEQEITLLRSTDDAHTWNAPEKVSFRNGARDGMPVPLMLQKKRGLVFAIEDSGMSGTFKPAIVFSSLKDNWKSGVRKPGSENRWSALDVLPPPHVSASAPYLRQMPSGETILSFQRSETGELKKAYMVVCIGDAEARHFNAPSRPFPITDGKAQLWNSLFVKDKKTIIAVSEATIQGIFGIWSVEGKFVRK